MREKREIELFYDKKPTLLFISPKYESVLTPNNMEAMILRVIKMLEYFFNVVYIDREFDFSEVVDRYEPDMVLFDGMIEGTFKQLSFPVRNFHSHPNIPRAAFCRNDSLSPSRLLFHIEMERLGIETYFIQADTSWGEGFPDVKDKVFYIPQFIDPDVFKDYGISKTVPIILSGNCEGPYFQYPWRIATKPLLINNYPTLYFTHPGYVKNLAEQKPYIIYGAEFSKALNASFIAPTSAGFKNVVISKQLEIPASRSCLITDPTKTLKIFGFEDMKNCVFSTPEEILDKVSFLFRNRDELKRITDNGYEYVHTNHTYMQRSQILQWLRLMKLKESDQKIIQPTLFGHLELVGKTSKIESIHIQDADDVRLINKGDMLFWEDRLEEAERCYKSVLDMCPYMAEPQLRLSLVALLRGQKEVALDYLKNNTVNLLQFGHGEIEPVEWGYLLITLLCVGKFEDALDYASKFDFIRHTTLERATWTVEIITGRAKAARERYYSWEIPFTPNASIQRFKIMTFQEEIHFFAKLLKACGHTGHADNLMRNLNSSV
jgi:tetratricopeptide (TPR) repeat protein